MTKLPAIDPVEAAGKAVDALLAAIGSNQPGAATAFKAALTRHRHYLLDMAGPEALATVLARERSAASDYPAEQALRGAAIGRKNYLFAGSDRGAERAAAFYTLIESAKLNGFDTEAHLRDVLTRIADYPAKRLADLLPWNWAPASPAAQAA